MNSVLKKVLVAAAFVISTQAAAQITFYEREGFAGQSFTAENQVANFAQNGFNDRASSVVVLRGRWEICEDARFSGRCVILRPGRYPSLAAMNMNNSVSSVRSVARNVRVDDNRYAPAPAAPQITFYEREGFEIAYYSSAGASAVEGLEGWKKSHGHNPVLINSGTWSKTEWKAIGIGIYEQYAVVWFGELEDKSKLTVCR